MIEHFEGTSLKKPASGSVKIYESNNNEHKLLRKLKVYEQPEGKTAQNHLELTKT